MKTYRIEHFHRGDKVYQLENEKLIMVVFGMDEKSNELFCGWQEENEKIHVHKFKPEELRKERDLNLLTQVF